MNDKMRIYLVTIAQLKKGKFKQVAQELFTYYNDAEIYARDFEHYHIQEFRQDIITGEWMRYDEIN